MLFAVCCLLSAVCCLLSAVYCLLSAVCCLLSAVCCLLSTVSSCCVVKVSPVKDEQPCVDTFTIRHPSVNITTTSVS